MYTVKVFGTRRNVLAFHHCDTLSDVRELLAVYRALGYPPEALVVEDPRQERAA